MALEDAVRADILVRSGSYFDFLRPEESKVCIEDIAHALSQICRFGGHTREFYSVAQHSILVSRALSDESIVQGAPDHWKKQRSFEGLLHDMAEAYIGDITSPLKQILPEYKAIEKRVEAVLFAHFGIYHPLPEAVKYADLVLLATEQRDLMPAHDDEWVLIKGIKPLLETIVPMAPADAFRAFMLRFEELAA